MTFQAFIQKPVNMSDADYYELTNSPEGRTLSKKIFETNQQIYRASDWQGADAIARSFLQSIQGHVLAFACKQTIAQQMLKLKLLPAPKQAKTQQLVQEYLSILLEYNNMQDADIMAQSLVYLQGYMSDADIKAIAERYVKSISVTTASKDRWTNDPEKLFGHIVDQEIETQKRRGEKVVDRQKRIREIAEEFQKAPPPSHTKNSSSEAAMQSATVSASVKTLIALSGR